MGVDTAALPDRCGYQPKVGSIVAITCERNQSSVPISLA